MRILLILPADNVYRYQKGSFSRNVSYAPLTLTTLAALVPADIKAEIHLLDEGVMDPDTFSHNHYDIVGLTAVVSSAPRAYELAAFWKRRGAHTLLGGTHVTLNPDEAARHADTVFVGFAENTFPQFLRDYIAGRPARRYLHDGGPLTAPIPRRDLMPKKSYIDAPTVIGNRGCRNNCQFCAIPRMWGSYECTRPVDEVVEEVRQLKSKRVLFLDPSPLSNKEYAKRLYEALVPLKIEWYGLATSTITRDAELFDLIVRSGCRGTLIGFETLSQDSNALIRKSFNNVAQYRETVKTLHRHDISVLGTFVLGFDGDTKESLRKTADLVTEIGVDIPRYAVLTPYPGTDIFRTLKAEGRILTEDWSKYDSEQVVFRPKNMTPNELQQIYYEVYERTYSAGNIARRIAQSNNKFWLSLISLGFKMLVNKMNRYTVPEEMAPAATAFDEDGVSVA